ncbi:MAG: hypothetical protein J6V22_06645, partial [Clostridia bacterium]|nr:hypothetical protein [Clostridia bacterium]
MKKKLQTLLKALLSDKRILIASICILSSISIFISGALYAKYVHNRDADIVASSPNFYFESDYLTATGAEYTLGSDVTSVVFALRNYADEFRFSDDDINFSLTVECLTDPSDTSATLSPNAGKIDKGAANEAPITLSNLKRGYSYRVVAIGVSGFRQTLQATFTVQAVVYRQRGRFICDPMALWHSALPRERQILTVARQLKNGGSVDFRAMSEMLFVWCGERLRADRTEKVHELSLRPEPFAAIAEGRKVYALRLWDEKRQQIASGDWLIFSNTEQLSKKLYRRVKALHIFDDFAQLYASLPLEKCGYLPQ